MDKKEKDKQKISPQTEENIRVVSNYMEDFSALYEDETDLNEERMLIRLKLTFRNIFLAVLTLVLGILIIGMYQTQTYGITQNGDYRIVTESVRNETRYIEERMPLVEILVEVDRSMEEHYSSSGVGRKTRIERTTLYQEWVEKIENFANGQTVDGSQSLTSPPTDELRRLETRLNSLLHGFRGEDGGNSLIEALQLEIDNMNNTDNREPNGLLPQTNGMRITIREEISSITRTIERHGGA